MDKSGFTSECFFLTYRALHLGYLKAHQQIREHVKVLEKMKSRKKEIQNSPNAQQQIAHLDSQINSIETILQCYQVHLFDIDHVKNYGNFYTFSLYWLLNLVDPNHEGLPLKPPTMEYGSMPEFIVEDIAEFFLVNFNFFPDLVNWVPLDDMITLFVLFLGSPSYVKNPYLRAKFLEVFAVLISGDKGRNKNLVLSLFANNKVAQKHLPLVLMKFYVDIEKTGSHVQFVDKFQSRKQIQVICKEIWEIPVLHQNIIDNSTGEQFILFLSKVLDDAIYLLEEGLNALVEIKALQIEMKDESWSTLSDVSFFL